ncbi:MAG: hypothetical protein NXI24_00750 [bacterium]|nr:hypothetical protein [bacterium]
MKLRANIKELPPLAGRLQRRFVLPRALQIFRRLSLRMDLNRSWPDLPYMNFVRRWNGRGDSQNDRPTSRASTPIHHTSLHTHIALSPVITRIVREEYTLPVRELRSDTAGDSRDSLDFASSAGPGGASAGENDRASRLVQLVQVVHRERPVVVRGTEPPRSAMESVGSQNAPAIAANQSDVDRSSGAAPSGLTYSRPERSALEGIAREYGLDSSAISLMAGAGESIGPDAEQTLPAPILPPEMQEFLQINPEDFAPHAKRFQPARRAGGPGGGQDDTPPVVGASSPGSASRAKPPELKLPDASADFGADRSGGSEARRFRASRKNPGSAATSVVREARRPTIEREPENIRDPRAEAEVQTAIVQDTVRKTLRTLSQPDVEAFADRVSRSIERRMQIDRDWRGDR